MKSDKRYTTQTLKKRVDHEGGSRHEPQKLAEPTSCKDCGAIYSGGRWIAKGNARESAKNSAWRPGYPTTCPACKQIKSGMVGGYVAISGTFLNEHRTEIRNLVENEAGLTIEDNPLSRIMGIHEKGDRLVIETTTEHLAQRLGHALKKAYAGDVSYDFSHENKVARVTWHRD
jgi:NMD protein affecting ribosome stability and mRNA decay